MCYVLCIMYYVLCITPAPAPAPAPCGVVEWVVVSAEFVCGVHNIVNIVNKKKLSRDGVEVVVGKWERKWER